MLEQSFKRYHEKQKALVRQDVSLLTGAEFETHIAKLLRNKGYAVQGTNATGDQGADLVAQKDGKTIVIQAKRYAGSVGNKAVQEVIGAMNYYGADEAWVVTNSTFTPHAKALAQKSNVRLFDGFDLKNNALFSS
jgi:restriction system protein